MQNEFSLSDLGVDFIKFEIKGNSNNQAIDNFKSAFQQMTSTSAKSRLVQSHITHISIGLVVSGIHNNVYQLGVLLLKCDANIDKVYSHT
jgi:hypothetical protein